VLFALGSTSVFQCIHKINLIFVGKKSLNSAKGSQGVKRYSKIIINTPIQSTIVPNFNMIGPFFTSAGFPKDLKKNGSQWPKKRDFQNMNLQVCRIST